MRSRLAGNILNIGRLSGKAPVAAAWAITLTLTLAVALAAGCGDDDGGDESGTDVQTDQAAQTEPERAIAPEDQRRAEEIVLKLDDLPEDWTRSAEDSEDRSAELNACAGLDFSDLVITGEAEEVSFAFGETEELTAEVSVFETPEQARQVIETYAELGTSARARDCFEDLLREQAEEADAEDDFEIGEVTLDEIRVSGPTAEEITALQVGVEIDANGQKLPLYVQRVLLLQGDAIAALETQDVVEPLSEDLRDDALQAMAERMASAPAEP